MSHYYASYPMLKEDVRNLKLKFYHIDFNPESKGIFRPRVAAVSINTVSLSLSLSLSVQKLFFLLRINICSVCVCVCGDSLSLFHNGGA